MQHVGLPVARNQIQSPSHTHGFFVKVDGENFVAHVILAARGFFLGGEEVAFGQPLFFHDLFPHVKNAVHRKTATSCGGVNKRFALRRVEHLHAHINHVARREILAFFTLARFIDEVFKRLVDHFQVGVEELDLFQ